MNESTVVKDYAVVKEIDFNKPDIYEVDYLLGTVYEDCIKKHFHSFVYTFVYDIKFTIITNNEKVDLTFILG